MLEDFFKVPPSHMKVPPDHYKGPQATSKGHAPLVDSRLPPWESVNKPMNFNRAIMVTRSLIIHEWNWPIRDSRLSYLNHTFGIDQLRVRNFGMQ